jgi:D-alanyl-D-alanine carboxypeptidase/D-alanyl-D-alanine-endopeptidase (penicillin-binding protein 4)
MGCELKRREFLAGIAASAVPHLAFANAPLRSARPVARPDPMAAHQVDHLLKAARISGITGFAVLDAETGETIDSLNAEHGFAPASVAKAVTARYALDVLGADFRFETKLLANGLITDGVLEGDLVLVGGGDPVLDSNHLAELAQHIKGAGIRKIKGRVLAHSGNLATIQQIDPSQPVQVGYNPAVSGLNLNFNRIYFEWKPQGASYDLSMDARTEERRPKVDIAAVKMSAQQTPIFTYAAAKSSETWHVAKPALGKGGGRWLPTRLPEHYCADILQKLLIENGISSAGHGVAETVPEGSPTLALWQSEALHEIVRGMLKYSTNLTAETLGRMATHVLGGPTYTLALSSAYMNGWLSARYGITAHFVDHSGLGAASRISPQDMAQFMLLAVSEDATYEEHLKLMGMRKSDGKYDKDSPLIIHAKTGTLNFVSGLSGVFTNGSGRKFVFAAFSNDFERRNGLSRAERENPTGGATWARRARVLQFNFIRRWSLLNS